jgi:hypothetical protein
MAGPDPAIHVFGASKFCGKVDGEKRNILPL